MLNLLHKDIDFSILMDQKNLKTHRFLIDDYYDNIYCEGCPIIKYPSKCCRYNYMRHQHFISRIKRVFENVKRNEIRTGNLEDDELINRGVPTKEGFIRYIDDLQEFMGCTLMERANHYAKYHTSIAFKPNQEERIKLKILKGY